MISALVAAVAEEAALGSVPLPVMEGAGAVVLLASAGVELAAAASGAGAGATAGAGFAAFGFIRQASVLKIACFRL